MIDVRRELDEAPIGPYHVLLVALVGLIVFFEAYGTFNVAYVVHYVTGPWRLGPGQVGFLVSSGLIGFMAGSLLHGRFADRYGRRPVLLCGLWMAAGFSLATALLGHSFQLFCGLRFCNGIGLGILLPLSVTYISEFSPARMRSTFATWGWGLGFSAGGVGAAAAGVFLTPTLGWPSLYYVGSLAAVVAVACHILLPESVQFLALHGAAPDRIRLTLAKLHPARSAVYAQPGQVFTTARRQPGAASVAALLSKRYRRTTLSVWGAAFFLLFAVYGLTGWVPTAMLQRGESVVASFSFGALILAANFVGTLASGYAADKTGCGRGSLAAWWVAGTLAVGTLAFVNLHLVNVICVTAAGFFILGGLGTLNNLTAGWYDTEVRGTGVGMMLGVGRIGGVLGPFITGLLQQLVPGSAILFLAIAAASFLGACMILLASPATAMRAPAGLESMRIHGTTIGRIQ